MKSQTHYHKQITLITIPKELQSQFDPFIILSYKTDPGYGYEHVKLLFIQFTKTNKYGLCIYDTTKQEYIEEPATLDSYEYTLITIFRKYPSLIPSPMTYWMLDLMDMVEHDNVKLTVKYNDNPTETTLFKSIGNESGLHDFAQTLRKEKWDRSGERVIKNIFEHLMAGYSIRVYNYHYANRDRGSWLPGRYIGTTIKTKSTN